MAGGIVKRSEFEHAVRAAGAILGVNEILVIGSQAVHATWRGELPAEALRSVEVDVAVIGDSDGTLADTLDGSIGEASMFHSTFGYYAQGVTEATAKLPEGWKDRLVRFQTPATGGVTAMCLEIHDLWISKVIAGRPKDVEFCRALVDARNVDPSILIQRLEAVRELDERVRDAVNARIARIG